MMVLKQSTGVTVKAGPFLDDTDGKTPETALTINQSDVKLSKNGGAFAQSNNSSGSPNRTHDTGGWYRIDLDTTDTNTLGVLVLSIQISGACPVWHEFMVMSANEYNSQFGTGDLAVNASKVGGATVASGAIPNAAAGADGGLPTVNANNDVHGVQTGVGLADDAITSAKISDSAVTAAKLADDAITAGKIAAGAIGASELAADALTAVAEAVADLDLAAYEAVAKSGTRLGDMIAAARAGALGRLELSGTTLTLYEADGSTVLARFTVAEDYSRRSAPA